MTKNMAIILAAGKGTRMKSKLYKVLHPVAGKPMVDHVACLMETSGFDRIVTVVGHGADQVKDKLGERSEYVLQAEQLGTGHAVMQASDLLENEEGATLVIAGDTPLFSEESIAALMNLHNESGAKATILSAFAEDPSGYGRVIRNEDQAVEKVVEDKDANDEEKKVQEVNTATYVFDNKALFEALKHVNNDNVQGEYYLPDVVEILKKQGDLVLAYQMPDMEEALGVNDRVALAEANRLMKKRINEKHMRNGVTLVDPESTYIEADVEIGSDTLIEPNVTIKGNTKIGEDCIIESFSSITNSTIEDTVKIVSSNVENSYIGKGSDVGPNSHIRPNSKLEEDVHVGNFVEVKNSTIGAGTKIGHLTYIGDADLGKNINVSCGVIFVNYDGQKKHRSTVGDNTFIGCNANIIAPVELAQNTFIAAGSTITDDVPEKAMAIARARQINKENYWDKLPTGAKQNC